jgi:hypothetical protein
MEAEQSQRQSFREAAQAFDRTPKLFRQLMKYKDDIAALRQKRLCNWQRQFYEELDSVTDILLPPTKKTRKPDNESKPSDLLV